METQNTVVLILAAAGVPVLVFLWYSQRDRRTCAPPLTKQRTEIALCAIIAGGVALRLLLAYWLPGHTGDMDYFRSWASGAYEGGLTHFYDGTFYADYPPLYVYVLDFFGMIQAQTGLDLYGAQFGFLLRLPAIAADALVGYFIYRAALPRWGGSSALTLSAFVLLNPAVMINSALWGQIDVILIAVMLAVVWALHGGRFFWGLVLFMLGFLLKPQCVFIAPILLYVLVWNLVTAENRRKAWLELAASAAAAVGMWFLLPLPLGIGRDPLWLVEQYKNTVSAYPQATLNAFNFYGLVGLNLVDAGEAFFGGIAAKNWGLIATAAVCIYGAWLFWKSRSRSKGYLFVLAGFLWAAVFTFVHGMHERYLFAAPFFLLTAYILLKNPRLLDSSILLFCVLLLDESITLHNYGSGDLPLPAALVEWMSLFEVLVFLYVAWTATSIAQWGPRTQQVCGARAECSGGCSPAPSAASGEPAAPGKPSHAGPAAPDSSGDQPVEAG